MFDQHHIKPYGLKTEGRSSSLGCKSKVVSGYSMKWWLLGGMRRDLNVEAQITQQSSGQRNNQTELLSHLLRSLLFSCSIPWSSNYGSGGVSWTWAVSVQALRPRIGTAWCQSSLSLPILLPSYHLPLMLSHMSIWRERRQSGLAAVQHKNLNPCAKTK